MKRFEKVFPVLCATLALASCGGGGGDSTTTTTTTNTIDGSHKVLAFNDLGMHCSDLDFSVFSILPPYNVVNAQVIERGAPPRIVGDQTVEVSYQAVADSTGSINTTSLGKSNFWDYAQTLFGLTNPLPVDEGLAGQSMPGTTNDPQYFNEYVAAYQWFSAAGIPILPIDDADNLNTYPLMQIKAVNPNDGSALASLDVVLPVASETDCKNCHLLGGQGADDGNTDYIDAIAPITEDQAARHNILVLHDSKESTNLVNSKPVLCSTCHYSEALAGTYDSSIGTDKTMSNVMHEYHGNAASFTNTSMEETCYQCHPGNITKCLRGAMGDAGIVCQDCHGSMLAVGGVNRAREPWLDEPKCGSCHTGDAVDNSTVDIRYRVAYDDDVDTATPRSYTIDRFAENTDTLYRNSLDRHGGVACEGCHGSPHAIWPSSEVNDNKAAVQLQGYEGTIIECGVCHTSVTLGLGGPHGMHPVNNRDWNLGHERFYESNSNACKACHGLSLEGTVLSRAATDRQYYRDDDGDMITVPKGTQISCTLCHGNPD